MKPSAEFNEFSRRYISTFEERYKHALEAFSGDMSQFEGAKQVIDEIFPVWLRMPLVFEKTTTKVKGVSKDLLKAAIYLHESNGFFTVNKLLKLVRTMGLSRGAIIMNLFKLHDSGIIRAMTFEELRDRMIKELEALKRKRIELEEKLKRGEITKEKAAKIAKDIEMRIRDLLEGLGG
ncbi:MAG: hypothetical protein DRH56_09295 [Deltaproteobacteria bacterium]|nr:MAG: hypothetical protein DRH56_09295 [Deltaproteobacteria bacterium]